VPLPEKALIAEVRRMVKSSRRNSLIATGIGDDCAVLRLPPQRELLVTTDFSLEGIHFRHEWHSPEIVGYRCLARGLSDIAAMGGEPIAAFLSLALPSDIGKTWVRQFFRSFLKLANEYRITLSGGDTAESSNGILADIMVLGAVPRGEAILRSGAHPGDRIYVSGSLGGPAAAIQQFLRLSSATFEGATPRLSRSARPGGDFDFRISPKKPTPNSYSRHFYPEPRLELGRILREKHLATAMIDLSDGLSTDLSHICEESGVGAEIRGELIPRARVGRPAREVSLDLALHGGEDYELLFTAPASKRIPAEIAGVPLTYIGVITRGRGICIRDGKVSQKLAIRGWEHFRR
jgi:thiamine-monophosphate kinase